MKLRTQFALALGGAAATGLILAGIVFQSLLRTTAFNIFAYHQFKQTEILGGLAGAAMSSGSAEFLRAYMAALTALPGVRYAYVAGGDGRIVLHSMEAFTGSAVDEWLRTSEARGAVEFLSPTVLGSDHDASVRVGYALGLHDVLSAEAVGAVLPSMALIGLLVLVLCALLAVLMAAYLAAPIQKLGEASARVESGDLEARVDASPPGELGELVCRFNAMVRRIGEADRMKDEFVALVSHDLRNPMAAIKMNLDYILNEDPDRDKMLPRHRGALARASASATRLGVFVTNILDAAKMKAGRMEYNLRPIKAPEILRGVEALYALTASQRGLSLVVSVADGLADPVADPERLEHVLSNLVSNSLKFTRPGGTITLSAATEGNGVAITVADTGAGIPPEELPALFQRFRQARGDARAAGSAPGTGLGLFIVKQSVEGMGGTISVDSTPGVGTRITVRFPRAAPPAKIAPRPAPSPAPGRYSAKILIVDDDDSFSEVTRLTIEGKGYRAVVAREGRLAFETVLKERPDLILMDMDLGGISGVDVLRRLRSDEKTARIPVILCSSFRGGTEALSGIHGGAVSFLAKPLKSSDLFARIHLALGSYSL